MPSSESAFIRAKNAVMRTDLSRRLFYLPFSFPTLDTGNVQRAVPNPLRMTAFFALIKALSLDGLPTSFSRTDGQPCPKPSQPCGHSINDCSHRWQQPPLIESFATNHSPFAITDEARKSRSFRPNLSAPRAVIPMLSKHRQLGLR